jgi:hypothetical protein
VLRPSEAVCAARSASRAEGAIADYAPYRDLYSSFDDLSFDGAGVHTIQDDDSDPAVIAVRIRKGLEAGTFRIS